MDLADALQCEESIINGRRISGELFVRRLLVAIGVALIMEIVVFLVVVDLLSRLKLSVQVVDVHGEVVFNLILLLLVLLYLVSNLVTVNFYSVISTVTAILVLVVNTLSG